MVSPSAQPSICGTELGLIKCLVDECLCMASRGGIPVQRCHCGSFKGAQRMVGEGQRQVRFNRVRSVQVCREPNK